MHTVYGSTVACPHFFDPVHIYPPEHNTVKVVTLIEQCRLEALKIVLPWSQHANRHSGTLGNIMEHLRAF